MSAEPVCGLVLCAEPAHCERSAVAEDFAVLRTLDYGRWRRHRIEPDCDAHALGVLRGGPCERHTAERVTGEPRVIVGIASRVRARHRPGPANRPLPPGAKPERTSVPVEQPLWFVRMCENHPMLVVIGPRDRLLAPETGFGNGTQVLVDRAAGTICRAVQTVECRARAETFSRSGNGVLGRPRLGRRGTFWQCSVGTAALGDQRSRPRVRRMGSVWSAHCYSPRLRPSWRSRPRPRVYGYPRGHDGSERHKWGRVGDGMATAHVRKRAAPLAPRFPRRPAPPPTAAAGSGRENRRPRPGLPIESPVIWDLVVGARTSVVRLN